MTLIAVSERRVSFFVCVALTISERKIIRCKNPVIPDNNNTDNRRECECKWKSSICSLYEKQILTETLSKLCSTWIWIFAPVDECLVLSLRVLYESDSVRSLTWEIRKALLCSSLHIWRFSKQNKRSIRWSTQSFWLLSLFIKLRRHKLSLLLLLW